MGLTPPVQQILWNCVEALTTNIWKKKTYCMVFIDYSVWSGQMQDEDIHLNGKMMQNNALHID